ncbi:putative Na+/H+ antiporter [Hydrogenophaga sp.]|uniref:putative Na+/H+ antiporter n=1 Tax=Hydrogenophaga sp. TaxID=1904254 RepID=UPI0033444EF0
MGSLVHKTNERFKCPLVTGALTSGGLTVIANAPNPGEQSRAGTPTRASSARMGCSPPRYHPPWPRLNGHGLNGAAGRDADAGDGRMGVVPTNTASGQ